MIFRVCLAVLAILTASQLQAGEIAPEQRRSAYDTMSAGTRAMQDDDMANPATLWVLDGEALWSQPAGATQKSCADCHGDAKISMKGRAARYPQFDATTGGVVDLEQQINYCRRERQKATPLAFESHELLALSAWVSLQSRGARIEASTDPAAQKAIEAGRRLFTERRGQLNLSCAQCHDDNWGRSLAGATIPQGHPNGYPLYRLEWQSLGSMRRRLRNCLSGMRAELWPQDAPEYDDLEIYLMSRASSLTMESPAVRP